MNEVEELRTIHERIRLEVEPSLEPMFDAHFERVVIPGFEAAWGRMVTEGEEGFVDEIREEAFDDFLTGKPVNEDLEDLYAEMVEFENEAYPLALRAFGLREMADLYRNNHPEFSRRLDRGHYLAQMERTTTGGE